MRETSLLLAHVCTQDLHTHTHTHTPTCAAGACTHLLCLHWVCHPAAAAYEGINAEALLLIQEGLKLGQLSIPAGREGNRGLNSGAQASTGS